MNLLPLFNPITPIQTISLFLLFVIWPFLSHDHELCNYGLGNARSTYTSLAILNYLKVDSNVQSCSRITDTLNDNQDFEIVAYEESKGQRWEKQ